MITSTTLKEPKMHPGKLKRETKIFYDNVSSAWESYIHCTTGTTLNTVIDMGNLNRGDYVLDVATGTGLVARRVSNIVGNTGTTVAIDFSSSMLNVAKKQARLSSINNLHLSLMDAEEIGFKNNFFDAVFCNFALFLFPNADRVLANMNRVLKYEGKIVMAVHGVQEKAILLSLAMNVLGKYLPNDFHSDYIIPSFFRFGNPEILKSFLHRANFRDVTIRQVHRVYYFKSAKEYWNIITSVSGRVQWILSKIPYELIAEIKKEISEEVEKYSVDGQLRIPTQFIFSSASK